MKPTSYTFDKYSTSFNFIYFLPIRGREPLERVGPGCFSTQKYRSPKPEGEKSRQTSVAIKHVNKVISEQALKD